MTDEDDVTITFSRAEARALLAAANDPTARPSFTHAKAQALTRALRKLEVLTNNSWGDDNR